ncbi:hypothetical protein KJ966_24930 [bacterium]|nr:hypothetical protein [bacterium]
MKKVWLRVLISLMTIVFIVGCATSEDDDDNSTASSSGSPVPSLHTNAKKVLPLSGQEASSSTTFSSESEYLLDEEANISLAAIGSFTYDPTSDYADQGFQSFFNGLFDSSNDTTTTTIMGLIAHGEFFVNDIYYSYVDTVNTFTDQKQAEATRTVKDISVCTGVGASDIEGQTVTLPYFNEIVTGFDCFFESTDLPSDHDALYNVFLKNDQSTDVKFLHSKINDSENGKQYLVFYGEYSETTHNFSMKVAQLDDKLDGDGSFDTNEWRLAAKVSGNVGDHTFTVQLSSGSIQMVGKGTSEGTNARFLAGFKEDSTTDAYFFCIDSSAATKIPVSSTSECSAYVADVEQMEFLDQISSSFSVIPTAQ